MKTLTVMIVSLLALFAIHGFTKPWDSGYVPAVDRAYDNLCGWPGLSSTDHDMLREDIRAAAEAGVQANSVLTKLEGLPGQVFITHVGWSVAICHLDNSLTIQQAVSYPAKQGFTICWFQGLLVILNRHPGTGMYNRIPIRVTASGGEFSAVQVSEDEKNDIMDYLTRNSNTGT